MMAVVVDLQHWIGEFPSRVVSLRRMNVHMKKVEEIEGIECLELAVADILKLVEERTLNDFFDKMIVLR